jgi:hypothetical protein
MHSTLRRSSSLLVICLSLTMGQLPVTAAGADAATACRILAERAAPTQSPVRPLRRWIGGLISEARRRSATLDGLIRTTESSRAVVYIDEAEADGNDWGGRTILMAASCGYTYLRIELRRLSPIDTASLLAHELQHVLEIVSSGATTAQQVEQLYQRIGEEWRVLRGRRFDTATAVRAGDAARLELRQRQIRPRTPSTAASRPGLEAAAKRR